MADKVLMNKNSLAILKNELSEYQDAQPVFEMKEQQLKGIVQELEENVLKLKNEIKAINEAVKPWAAVMAEQTVDLSQLVRVAQVLKKPQEIAGVEVETFVGLHFQKIELDYFKTPLWVDAALKVLKQQKKNQILLGIEQQKVKLLQEELAEARRMKNALQEVFIPEAIELIRKIEIHLGDIERLTIGCAKLIKKKKKATV